MRIIIVVFCLLLYCPTAYGQGELLRKTVVHDNIEREYKIYVPSTYTPETELPLVVSMHGANGTSDSNIRLTGFNRVAEVEGFITVYPAAIAGNWEGGEDNVGFIDTVIDSVEATYSIDALRVYATGKSQGGFMGHLLAESLNHRIAAIAAVSFSGLPGSLVRPFPVLSIYGTADRIAPFNGGTVFIPGIGNVNFIRTQDSIDAWLANNSCNSTPLETTLPDVFTEDKSTVTKLAYEECDTYTSVSGKQIAAEYVFYRVDGGGHAWPTTADQRAESIRALNDQFGNLASFLLPLNSDIDASTEIWNFFSRHELAASDVPGPALLAGDADQDLDFDQIDLVQVQIAAKYLSGRAATWGEGDWNGAPGGSQGNPPQGNGLFNQLDIVAAQQAGKYLTGPYAAIRPHGQSNDGQTSIVYHADTGEIAVDALVGMELTSINIDSASGIFTGDTAENLGGSFDNDADDNIFKATFGSSFGSISFGMVAQPGLAEDFVQSDLTVLGSLQGGGPLGNVDLIYVPEPSTVLLLILGALAIFHHRSLSVR